VCRVHGGPQRARPGRGGKNLVTIFNGRGQVANKFFYRYHQQITVIFKKI
jgi:hypothetical protein